MLKSVQASMKEKSCEPAQWCHPTNVTKQTQTNKVFLTSGDTKKIDLQKGERDLEHISGSQEHGWSQGIS